MGPVQPFWRTTGQSLSDSECAEPAAQRFHVMDLINLEEVIGQVGKDVCTEMFNAALFIIVKNWEHSNCPTTEDSLHPL